MATLPPAPLSRPSRAAGFTAIELIATLAIAAILATLAMPSFLSLVERYRTRRASDDLRAALFLARSEALRRGGNVTLGKITSPGCTSTGATDWSCGWSIFADTDNDGTLDPNEETIQVWAAPERVDVTIRTAQSLPQFQIDRWGRFGNTLGFSIRLRPQGNNDPLAAVVLCMSAAGRLRSSLEDKQCTY